MMCSSRLEVVFRLTCTRSMWQRAEAVRLFVEHVALFDEQDSGLKSESVVRLWKVQSALSSFVLCKQLQ